MDGTNRTKPVLAAVRDDAASALAHNPEWVACLQEACESLWPPPARVAVEIGEPGWSGLRSRRQRVRDPQSAEREFVLVPWFGRPPVLVPSGYRAAGAAVRHYSVPRSAAARLFVNVFSLAVVGGLSGAMLRGRVRVVAEPGLETIEAYLRALLSRDIRLGMYLGPARANRKPVLQLLTGTGETVGFAKIGFSPLTSRLVRAERDALERVGDAGLRGITVPQVLHYGTWHGLDVLVLSALPAWRRRHQLTSDRLAAAMLELARVGGLRRGPLAGSEYLRRLRMTLATADESADQAGLIRALDTLAARADGRVLTFGAWHGDWAPWNMSNIASGLMVWDWERFAHGVPYGFDALHYWLQTELRVRRRDPRAAACKCIEDAPRLLSPFGIDAGTARVTATLYMTDLAARYLADRQEAAGAALGAPGAWLLPAVADEVARM